MGQIEARGKYPEYRGLELTEKPSSYLIFSAGLDLAQIVEAKDDIRRLQLDFIAAHNDPIVVTVQNELNEDHDVGMWEKLGQTPAYFQEVRTHIWFLASPDGATFYPFMQSAIQEIIQPDDKNPFFRIIIKKEVPPDVTRGINPDLLSLDS